MTSLGWGPQGPDFLPPLPPAAAPSAEADPTAARAPRRRANPVLVRVGFGYLVVVPALTLAGNFGGHAPDGWTLHFLQGLLISVGSAGCLELARRYSPVPGRTRLDRVRRWLGSIAFAISYPTLCFGGLNVITKALFGRAGDLGLRPSVMAALFWVVGLPGLALALFSAVLAAIGLVVYLLRPPAPRPGAS